MATPEQTPYNTYLGNGVTTEFSIGFDYTDTDSVKVYIKRSGGEEELLQNTDYSFVNTTTIKFPAQGSSEAVLAVGDVMTIQRETTVENDFVFSNQKRLFPEDVMEADDNEMRILQEHARQLGRALVLPPTSQVDPDDVIGQVERVYDSIDNIDTVADSISDVNNVSDNMTKVSDVSSNMTSVSGVYSNMSKITSVYNNRTNITAVANNATNINTVAGDKANIDAVAGDISNIDAVAGNATNINAVNANKTNINTVASNISNVNNVSTNMAKVTSVYDNMSAITAVNSNATNINSCATNMSAILDAPNQAANAKRWAIGDPSEPSGGSAKYWAERAHTFTEGVLHTDTISNCLTFIPQDISVELSSGTLTLKSGSKVYIPNGSNTFDTVTLTTDKTISGPLGNGLNFIEVDESTSNLSGRLVANSVSGAGVTTAAGLAYDTTTNRVGFYNANGSLSRYTSFPIAIVNVESSTITEIVQVFNGFGYIGSTIFVLPGVKGLIPNGRNEDGTLKSTSFANTVAKVYTQTSDRQYYIRCANNYLNAFVYRTAYYDEEANEVINNNAKQAQMIAGTYTVSGGKITEFNPKTVFHALDWNDKSTIAGWGMPSNRYIDLTLGASGATYTAPDNGYFYLAKSSTAANQGASIRTFIDGTTNPLYGIEYRSTDTDLDMKYFFPVKKGTVTTIDYGLGGSTNVFRFIYAEGEV